MALGPDTTPGTAGEFRSGSIRGVDGFFRLAQHVTGQWWLLDPSGRPCFVRAVHGVRAEPADSDLGLRRDPAVRLREWAFNAVGVGGDGAGAEDGLPFLQSVDFLRAGPVISAPEVRLPDVFAPDWPARALQHAAVACAPRVKSRGLLAWLSDAELAWGPAVGRPGLLQVCLSLEPSYAAYHAAWEFVLASHGGRLDAVARAWSVPLANKEVVREMTRLETGIRSRGYHRDDGRWTREFARRYFTSTAAAIRAADPHHLLGGACFRSPVGAAVLGAAAFPVADFLLPHWLELTGAAVDGMPVLAGEFGWHDAGSDEAPAGLPAARRRPRLTSIERRLRRGRTILKRLARHPAVVGYVWQQWHDAPGEQPPFARGLVHVNGTEAREHLELLTEFNLRAEAVRRAATKLLSS